MGETLRRCLELFCQIVLISLSCFCLCPSLCFSLSVAFCLYGGVQMVFCRLGSPRVKCTHLPTCRRGGRSRVVPSGQFLVAEWGSATSAWHETVVRHCK